MCTLWLAAGGAIAFVSGLSIRWAVARVGPGPPGRVLVWTIGGVVFRLSLAALVLMLALKAGISKGLMALLGLWLGRWAAVWYLLRSPRRLRVGESL